MNKTIPECPRCFKVMIKRTGVNGEFWGCTNFPTCKGSRDLDWEAQEQRWQCAANSVAKKYNNIGKRRNKWEGMNYYAEDYCSYYGEGLDGY